MSNATTLPEKYYLQHFYEFLTFIESTSGHLVDVDTKDWIQDVRGLTESARCLWVRLLNRNVGVVHEKTLVYEEIPDLESVLIELTDTGFIRFPSENDWPGCLTFLTKDELLTCLNDLGVGVRSSLKKQQIIDEFVMKFDYQAVLEVGLFSGYWVKTRVVCFQYLLFLYFGNVDSRLNKFSLRDLGKMSTLSVDKRKTQSSRFSDLEEARLCFDYSLVLHQLKNAKLLSIESIKKDVAELSKPTTDKTLQLYNKLIVKVARLLEREDELEALVLYRLLNSPEAEERRIRLEYKLGDRSLVKERLEFILERPASESLLLFAEDFLARKFGCKKTSELTDVLRASSVVPVDELFRHNVEQGVANVYREQGFDVVETENWFWRTLFGLTFWKELFESPLSVSTEFDLIPECLIDGRFSELHQSSIDVRLDTLNSRQDYIEYIKAIAQLNAGVVNGLFVWRANLIDQLIRVLLKIELQPLKKVLVQMALNYSEWNDGFPDLALVDEASVRFVEVKSPGDSLRRNQLVTINRLKKVGFDAEVVRVDWVMDPNQVYTVVDIETTGGTKHTHRITEIGAVKVVAGEVVERWQSLVNPQRHIPSFITQLTGISDQMVEDAPAFSEIANKLSVFLEGSIFVAHNANFDYGFIKTEYERLGEEFSMPKLCTVKEMKRHYPGYESYGLSKLCAVLDINLNQHHRALCDAEATAQLLIMINHKRFS